MQREGGDSDVGEKELIFLDARLVEVIKERAFRAILANGHELVAFARAERADEARSLREGMTVRVRMTPFDMSTGEIVFEQKR